MNIKKILASTGAAAAIFGFAAVSVFAASNVVYNSIPSPQPANVASIGYEATSTSEFGGQVQLASAERIDPTVTVLMSSWACENGSWTNNGGECTTTPGSTFTHDITLNVYNVSGDDCRITNSIKNRKFRNALQTII